MLPRKIPTAARPRPISSGWWWLRGRRGPLRVLTRLGTLGRSRDLRFFRATGPSSARSAGLLLHARLDHHVPDGDDENHDDQPAPPGPANQLPGGLAVVAGLGCAARADGRPALEGRSDDERGAEEREAEPD